MKYAFIFGSLLFLSGCHPGDVVTALQTPDPAQGGKTPAQVIVDSTLKAAANPYAIDNWITLGTTIATLVAVGFGVKKSAANHDTTQTAVSDLADAVSKVAPAVKTT